MYMTCLLVAPKTVTINGKKYVQKISEIACDEPFKYLEEIKEKKKKSI